MKKIIVLLPLFISFIFAQFPQLTKDKNTDEPMLIGKSERVDYEKRKHFKEWFKHEYVSYDIDIETLSLIKESNDEINIECFMGTWCSDSRREIPRMYKILDEIIFDKKKLKMVSVDRKMMSPGNEEKGKNIHHVPTIIFYNNKGKEIGRIIESPVGSLEEDFVDIYFGNPPIPHYADWKNSKK